MKSYKRRTVSASVMPKGFDGVCNRARRGAFGLEGLERRLLLDSTVLYRVNAGGPALSGTPAWSADLATSPSPYSNAAQAMSETFAVSNNINVGGPSVPPGTPAALFQTQRFDKSTGSEMSWSFPVTAGLHEVRLYMAETYSGTQALGVRLYDVSIEGSLVLNDYDPYGDVGGYTGVVKSYVVNSDSSLDIAFARILQNPQVAGIEISRINATSNRLGVSANNFWYSPTLVGGSVTQQMVLRNLGAAGDPTITVTGATLRRRRSDHVPDVAHRPNKPRTRTIGDGRRNLRSE